MIVSSLKPFLVWEVVQSFTTFMALIERSSSSTCVGEPTAGESIPDVASIEVSRDSIKLFCIL